jgi:hypothetical protein
MGLPSTPSEQRELDLTTHAPQGRLPVSILRMDLGPQAEVPEGGLHQEGTQRERLMEPDLSIPEPQWVILLRQAVKN